MLGRTESIPSSNRILAGFCKALGTPITRLLLCCSSLNHEGTTAMALRTAALKTSSSEFALGLRRWLHAAAQPVPIDSLIHPSSPPISSPSFVLPDTQNDVGLDLPSSIPIGSMELMAVPKKKVSRHKRGIRNGPKALKPVPVIIRCKSCGRVKLPHFFCCSGYRENANEQN